MFLYHKLPFKEVDQDIFYVPTVAEEAQALHEICDLKS